jgi:uncharacterized damage-inducible protein DinB
MPMIDAIVQEIEREGATTRRVLERVPGDRLSWKPHTKSMSLGELALHVAETPGSIAGWALKESVDFGGADMTQKEAASSQQVLSAHDASIVKATETIRQLGDTGLEHSWQATAQGATLMAMPKAALVRSIMLNHWYHHRGQLSVYLRLLDVPVPSIYGPSADENPFRPAS